MSKKGGSNHKVRMTAHKRIGVLHRKRVKWLLAPAPGPHAKADSVSAGVLVRDVLGRARSIREAKKILNSGGLLVDGKKIKDVRFPIGLMDVVSLPSEKMHYRVVLQGPNMVPKKIGAEAASMKYLKVIRKHVISGGKTAITFHDGRNYLGDNNLKTGDTCVLSVPGFKLLSHIKLAPGAQCLVTEGKHRGDVARLEKIIERPGSHESEVLMKGAAGDFVTVAKYLFAIDANYA
ncbi:30S ribosomal protein S4e [uncultured archaeon]|nr:30S ribosomal protein S4e [uncultured archaeon]